jgi:hypothetical protein
MNDRSTRLANVLEQPIHARRQFIDAANGAKAMVRIPHVTDDNGRLGKIPRLPVDDRSEQLTLVAHRDLSPKLQIHGFRGNAYGRHSNEESET